MKRRLPTINKGKSVLAAISRPPLTTETNRHHPSADQPGKPMAASHEALSAANAHATRSTSGVTTWPPSSTASAENATATRPARHLKRRTQPRAVS